MNLTISFEENYNILRYEEVISTFDLTTDYLETHLPELKEVPQNPSIITFQDELTPDEYFFQWTEAVKNLMSKNGLQWILVPPFPGQYDKLESDGIQFAPTFPEAVDMAFMIKIEQDLSDDDPDEEN